MSARANAGGEGVERVWGEAADDDDEGVDAVEAGKHEPDDHGEDDERADDAHHQRAGLPAAGHRNIPGGQPATTSSAGRSPNRRASDAYSASPALTTSGPKSA